MGRVTVYKFLIDGVPNAMRVIDRTGATIDSNLDTMVQSLLAMNVQIEVKDNNGQTQLALAVQEQSERFTILLLEAGARISIFAEERSAEIRMRNKPWFREAPLVLHRYTPRLLRDQYEAAFTSCHNRIYLRPCPVLD